MRAYAEGAGDLIRDHESKETWRDRFDRRAVEGAQGVEVGDVLGVELQLDPVGPQVVRVRGAEAAEERFDARVDVGAVEGRPARARGRRQVAEQRRLVDGLLAVPLGELPATDDQARGGVAVVAEGGAFHLNPRRASRGRA